MEGVFSGKDYYAYFITLQYFIVFCTELRPQNLPTVHKSCSSGALIQVLWSMKAFMLLKLKGYSFIDFSRTYNLTENILLLWLLQSPCPPPLPQCFLILRNRNYVIVVWIRTCWSKLVVHSRLPRPKIIT